MSKKGLPDDAELRHAADLKVGDTILIWGRESKVISLEEHRKLWILDIEDLHTRQMTTLVRYPDEVIVVKK